MTSNERIEHAKKNLARPRARNNKRVLTDKQKAFAQEYAKTLNGTQSALKVYDVSEAKDPRNLASVIATENLAKPSVRAEIDRILSEVGVTLNDVVSIHKRNMIQEEHLPTSQRATEKFYELMGITESESKKGNVNVAFIIEN